MYNFKFLFHFIGFIYLISLQYSFPWGKESIDSMTVRSDLHKHLTNEELSGLPFSKESLPCIIQIKTDLNTGKTLKAVCLVWFLFVWLSGSGVQLTSDKIIFNFYLYLHICRAVFLCRAVHYRQLRWCYVNQLRRQFIM